jgi:hypothetical protein
MDYFLPEFFCSEIFKTNLKRIVSNSTAMAVQNLQNVLDEASRAELDFKRELLKSLYEIRCDIFPKYFRTRILESCLEILEQFIKLAFQDRNVSHLVSDRHSAVSEDSEEMVALHVSDAESESGVQGFGDGFSVPADQIPFPAD